MKVRFENNIKIRLTSSCIIMQNVDEFPFVAHGAGAPDGGVGADGAGRCFSTYGNFGPTRRLRHEVDTSFGKHQGGDSGRLNSHCGTYKP